jgi:hypothetical protein
MPSGIPQDEAAAVSIGLEAILYGEYRKWDNLLYVLISLGFSLLMFIGTIWALTRNDPLRNINRPIAVIAILLLVLSTAVSSIAIHIQYHC